MNFRLFTFIVVFVFGIVFSIPSIFQKDYAPKISLGLDLQGGIHMLLGVKADQAVASKVKAIASSVKYFAKKNNYLIESFTTKPDGFSMKMYDQGEALNVENFLKR